MQHQSETPDSKRKAVVIGGCGFLGRRLVAMLSGGDASLTPSPEWPRFDHVHVFDRAPFVETDAERASRERGGVGLTSSTGTSGICAGSQKRSHRRTRRERIVL